MVNKRFIKRGLTILGLAVLLGGLLSSCITTGEEGGGGNEYLNAALARRIDSQLGPVDNFDGSHLKNSMEGQVDRNMVTMLVRMLQDNPFWWGPFLYNPAARGVIHEWEGFGFLNAGDHSVSNNPCTQDLDRNGFPDYCDLCLDKCADIDCKQITEREFRIKYAGCRWRDYYIYTSTTYPVTDYSTAYWTIWGTAVYHYGMASIDEQIIEISYNDLEFELHDFVSLWAHDRWDLPNTWYRINGDELSYRVLTPWGDQAMGTTGDPDRMMISDYTLEVDDDNDYDGDNDAHNERYGKYKVRLAYDWEDGLVFLQDKSIVMPNLPRIVPIGGGWDAFVLFFYDKDHPAQDGVSEGCRVVVDNVDDILRTYDMYGTGTGNYGYQTTCLDLETRTGIPW